jgi:hypothetical protein
MKVGNLVSVKRTHGRDPVVGIIIEIKEDEHNRLALVEPISGGMQIYANPLDVEVLSDCG